MDINDFSKDLTDVVNKGLSGGVPILYACAALDAIKFELQSKSMMMNEQMNATKFAEQMAKNAPKNGKAFEPKIVIEDKSKN